MNLEVNIGTLKYIKQMLMELKGEINNNTTIVGDFNIPLSKMDHSDRQLIRKEWI